MRGVKTQKARGVMALGELLGGRAIEAKVVAAKDVKDMVGLPNLDPTKYIFARPCPMRPEHGFIESRVVKTIAELRALADEVLAVAPEGEILLCPQLSGERSAVWSQGVMVIGQGHDGVTSGKAVEMEFPFSVQLPESWLRLAGIDPTSPTEGEAFVELVKSITAGSFSVVEHWKAVQLRGGPRLEGAEVDILPPEDLVVSNIIHFEAGMDLVAWKTLMETSPKGTVVIHNGGTLRSHQAIHCKLNGIPFLTSREVILGETLGPRPQQDFLQEMAAKGQPGDLLAGVRLGMMLPLQEQAFGRAGKFATFALHQAVGWMEKPETMTWLGFGVALAYRLGSAAAIAEARHSKEFTTWAGSTERSTWYKSLLSRPAGPKRAKLRGVYKLFGDPRWSSGMGGPAWKECTRAVLRLGVAIGRLENAQTPLTLKNVLEAYNETINQAHNNGWWFNKFVPETWFDLVSKGGPELLVEGLGVIEWGQKAMTTPVAITTPASKCWPKANPMDTTLVYMANTPQVGHAQVMGTISTHTRCGKPHVEIPWNGGHLSLPLPEGWKASSAAVAVYVEISTHDAREVVIHSMMGGAARVIRVPTWGEWQTLLRDGCCWTWKESDE